MPKKFLLAGVTLGEIGKFLTKKCQKLSERAKLWPTNCKQKSKDSKMTVCKLKLIHVLPNWLKIIHFLQIHNNCFVSSP